MRRKDIDENDNNAIWGIVRTEEVPPPACGSRDLELHPGRLLRPSLLSPFGGEIHAPLPTTVLQGARERERPSHSANFYHQEFAKLMMPSELHNLRKVKDGRLEKELLQFEERELANKYL